MPTSMNALHTHYRWIIVAAGGALGCVAIGGLFSLPVFLRPIAQDTGWSTTGISTAMTFAFVALALGSIGWGYLSDRVGPRIVVLAGSVLLATGLALASLATSLVAFQVLFGVVVGISAAAIFAPLMACVTGWFDTRRSLAVSLVSAGMGMAPMTMSPLAAWLIEGHDWRSSLQIIAALSAVIMVPLAMLIRRPPALAQAASAAAPGSAHQPALSVGQAMRSAPFLILVLTSFLSCATHSGPIFHTVSYAVTCGIPLMAAVSIYSLEGLAGMGGRLVFGLLGDRFGAARVLVLALLAQAIVVLGYVLRPRAGQLLHGGGAVRLHLRRRDAALCRDRAREFSAPHDGHGHRQHDDGQQPRHGARTGARRAHLRHVHQLCVAVCRRIRAGQRANAGTRSG